MKNAPEAKITLSGVSESTPEPPDAPEGLHDAPEPIVYTRRLAEFDSDGERLKRRTPQDLPTLGQLTSNARYGYRLARGFALLNQRNFD